MKSRCVSRLLTLTLTTALGACGSDSADKEREDVETLFDPLTETLDRAEDVEDMSLEHKKAMDERMRQMEEGADDNGSE